MSSAIEILVKQAIKTFSRKTAKSVGFDENFRLLKTLTDKISADDILLNSSLTSNKPSKAPVTYVEIYEDQDVTIGVFILKPGSSLPLHDHPKMYGILKVLIGTVNIQSYSVIENQSSSDITDIGNIFSQLSGESKVLTKKHSIVTLSSEDKACTLNASERNLHAISHTDGQFAAFLDVLAPPYCDTPGEEKRDCHYFQEVEEVIHPGSILSWLKRIPSPSSFWSDTAAYFGPQLGHLTQPQNKCD